MPQSAYVPLQTGLSRVYIIEGRARADHEPDYHSCSMAGSISWSLGDVESIYCPDPARYNQFIEIGTISGARERATLTLTGRYALSILSDYLRLARVGCPMDVQIHMGECEDPFLFNDFAKALILENVLITSYDTDDLGTLDEDGKAPVNEMIDVSAENIIEVIELTVERKADTVITVELVDGVVCDTVSCGGCEVESEGCDRIYFVSLQAGGSPGTPPDVVYSLDNGVTWYAHDIDTMLATEDPTGVACLAGYVVVVSNDTDSLHYAPQSDVTPDIDPAFVEVATGFVAAGSPNAIRTAGGYAFVVGDGGYVYGTSDPTQGVTVLDAGAATGFNLTAVHSQDGYFAVAVGASGAIVTTSNRVSWTAVTPVNVSFVATNFSCVWVIDEQTWWLGATNGQVWYTVDGGTTFYQKAMPVTCAAIHDIEFPFESVGYVSGETATPAGVVFRSYDGGYSWVALPEGTGNLPASDRITALATCVEDPNFFAGGGLHDDGADGVLIVGRG